MRSGKLDRTITIRRLSEPTYDEYGAIQDTGWQDVAALKAQLLQQTTKEYLQNQGANDEALVVFKTRYLEGITNADQIRFDGDDYNIREIAVIGRNRYLELRAEQVAS